jgi:hypothetical protein
MLLFIANLFGVSVARLLVYTGIIVALFVGALAIRQHYINKGYHSAIEAVKKQDAKAVAGANKVEEKTAVCTETSGYWLQVGGRGMKIVLWIAVAAMLGGCAGQMPARVKGECKVFDDPGFAVQGKRLKDKQWIGKAQETGIQVCGWNRPTK